jgi:putative FmdB family regulatory protein
MPTYTYACCACEHRQDALRPLAEHDAPLACAKCGGETRQVINAQVRVHGDYPEYTNMIDGKPIRGRKEHREFLRRNDCVESGNTGEW